MCAYVCACVCVRETECVCGVVCEWERGRLRVLALKKRQRKPPDIGFNAGHIFQTSCENFASN